MTDEPQPSAEWLDERGEETATDRDELLDTGRSRLGRHPRLVRAAIWLVVALVVGTATVRTLRHNDVRTPVAAPSAPVRRAALPATRIHRSTTSASIETVLDMARQPALAGYYVRQTSPPGACVLVRVGSSPLRAILRAVRRDLPGATDLHFFRTMDEFTALCSVDVRARFHRAVLTVSITAPSSANIHARFAHIQTGILTTGNVTTEYASSVSLTGWGVLVGATGTPASMPGTQQLLAFAQDERVTW